MGDQRNPNMEDLCPEQREGYAEDRQGPAIDQGDDQADDRSYSSTMQRIRPLVQRENRRQGRGWR
ncbi:hypothetical protein [Streptomyces sp. NPDC088261]|uniref:hypothetical protein n=1 Tax=Streptomyces sp. NPDC088261 TaxID=3365851 RepID=UPI00380BAC35